MLSGKFMLLLCLMPQLLCMLTINSSFMIAKNCLLHYLCMIFLLKPILLLHFVWFCITHVWMISQIRKTYVSASPWRFNLYYLSINLKISLAVLNTLRYSTSQSFVHIQMFVNNMGLFIFQSMRFCMCGNPSISSLLFVLWINPKWFPNWILGG